MSATPTQAVTYDVGARISRTLRPTIGKKLENWEKRRAAMKDVCAQCHARDRRGGQLALGIAREVGIGPVVVDPEQAPAAELPLHVPDGALQHGADLARLQVRRPSPAQLAALLVPGAVLGQPPPPGALPPGGGEGEAIRVRI